MSDYGGYGAIVREAQVLADAEKSRPVLDCPKCGLRLVVNKSGETRCPMGH